LRTINPSSDPQHGEDSATNQETARVSPPNTGSEPGTVSGDVEYTDDQFLADLEKAKGPLQAMADRARERLRAGTARKFPG
jgi:hypothetical protein